MADTDLTRLLESHADCAEGACSVPELTGIIAHRLAQPLGAANNYAAALERNVRRGCSEDDILQLSDKLRRQLREATAILDQLRAFDRDGA